MTEKDIEKISEQYKDEKAPLYDKIHQRVEEMYVQQARKRKKLNTFYKVFPVALVLILTLAIVLPIVLQSDETTVFWYSDTDITSALLGDTLKEYARKNNESFLYIDLGALTQDSMGSTDDRTESGDFNTESAGDRTELADDRKTYRYYENADESKTAYLQESFTHGKYGYFIQLTVMKSNVVVETFDSIIEEPHKIAGYPADIYYQITREASYAQFEYNGYKYYLEIRYEVDEAFLTEILDNMFSTQQAVA